MVWRVVTDAEIGGWLQERLRSIHASSLTALSDIPPRPQVYLDPMFPHKQKRAGEKEMRVFQSLVGRILMPMDCLEPARVAGNQTRGGEASGLCAAAGECRHAKRGSH